MPRSWWGQAGHPSALGLNQTPAAGDRHQNAQGKTQRHHGRATVADKRQGHAYHRQDATDHAHVDKGVGEKDEGDAARQQAGEQRGAFGGDGQAPKHQHHEAHNQQAVANQAKFFGESGKHKVCGALRDEVELSLGALHQTLAPKTARTNGNHALDDVKTFAQGIASRV